MTEIWKDINGYEGLYQVSNLGRVKSLDRVDCSGRHRVGVTLKPGTSHNGYLFVRLSKNSKYSNKRINRLVAEHFIDNPLNKPEVNHCDGNKLNNQVDNLEWSTRSENTLHAFASGLKQPSKGESHGQHKLTKELVHEIKSTYKPYDVEFGCHALSRKYGISPSQVCSIAKGVYWNE